MSIKNLLEKTVENVLKTYTKKGEAIIIGVSGGPDSIALLSLLRRPTRARKQKIIAAHLNHGIRGKTSDLDAKFVEQICKKWRIKCIVERTDVPAMSKKQKLSLEQAGRNARYTFFYRLKEEFEAGCIMLAHHRDDNVETILSNLIRGCSLNGLTGISMYNRDIVRPLLDYSKKELMNYCKSKKIAFRKDKTNKDTTIRRNYIRHVLLPNIEKLNKNFREGIHAKSLYFEEIDDYMRTRALNFIKKRCQQIPGGLICEIQAFKKTHSSIQKYIIQVIYELFHGSTEKLSADQIEEILNIISKARTGSQKFLGNRLNIGVTYGNVIFLRDRKREQTLPQNEIELPVPGTITYPGGKIITRIHEALPKRKKKNAIYVILKEDKVSLYVRGFQPGDRMKPAGLNGTKKLQDLFVDEKIPRNIRKNIPIIIDEKGSIIAVGTIRIDQSYHPKFFNGTVLEIQFLEE